MTDAPPQMITFTIDGREVQAAPGRNLIDACEDAGVYIPRFCYHPRMTPVGMCRMCLVEVDTGRGPALQPSCMLTVSDGMVVDTESEITKKAQDGVLEFLLINHPLDCPVCDKGGECPLQDQTMAYGPGETRFIEEKRHYEKPIPINDNVYLDRERCILCDRCTRFADEVAGDPLIHFIDRGNQTQVNTFPDQPFASYFSGNVVQICPVGALTAKPYRFKARPWDLDETNSTYPNPMGDRINVQASRNQVLRIQGVDSDAVNWGWMTDKERFAFEALQSPTRLAEPLVRGGGLNKPDPDGPELVASNWSHALGAVSDAVNQAIDAHGAEAIGFIGGARLTNESQYAWTKLAKGLIGTDNVDAQLDDGLPPEVLLSLPRATIADIGKAGGTVILLGPDPKEDLGTLYLRLRHGVTQAGVKLIELTPTGSGLTAHAAARLHARPGDVGVVAQALVTGQTGTDVGGVTAADLAAAHALVSDGPVTVIVGRTSLAESVQPTLDALAALSQLDGVKFLPALRRGNIMGALDMGMAPGVLPGRNDLDLGRTDFRPIWTNLSFTTGMDTTQMLQAAADGKLKVLFLLGADPLADFPNTELAAAALEACPMVVAVDLFVNQSVAHANVVFPAAAFTEASGTHTNIEGRITAINQKVTPPGTARPDWMIASELAMRLGHDLGIESPEDVWAELSPISGVHANVSNETVAAVDGVLAVGTGSLTWTPADPITSTTPDNYSVRLVLSRRMFDHGTMVQEAPSLAGLAGPAQARLNPHDFNQLGIAVGDTIRLVNANGMNGKAAASFEVDVTDSVPRGVVLADLNRGGDDVRALISLGDFTEVKLETTGGNA